MLLLNTFSWSNDHYLKFETGILSIHTSIPLIFLYQPYYYTLQQTSIFLFASAVILCLAQLFVRILADGDRVPDGCVGPHLHVPVRQLPSVLGELYPHPHPAAEGHGIRGMDKEGEIKVGV